MSRSGMPETGRFAGIITARELAAAGLSGVRIRTLVRRGLPAPVCRGVYARAEPVGIAAGAPGAEHALQVAGALVIAGPQAAASHHSAALLHHLDILGRPPAGIVTVTRSPEDAGSRTARPGIVLHAAALPAEHVMTLAGGLRVTTVARTVIDLARASSLRAGVVAADSALRSDQTSKGELQAVLAACTRWPGIRRAREVARFSDRRSESVLESLSRVVFREQRLPPPELQVWAGGDELVGRADFLWRQYRTIGEADGALKYADSARAMAQLQRDVRLREAGFEVVHFTWSQIVRVPHQVAASLKMAFQRGERVAVAG